MILKLVQNKKTLLEHLPKGLIVELQQRVTLPLLAIFNWCTHAHHHSVSHHKTVCCIHIFISIVFIKKPLRLAKAKVALFLVG